MASDNIARRGIRTVHGHRSFIHDWKLGQQNTRKPERDLRGAHSESEVLDYRAAEFSGQAALAAREKSDFR